MHIAHTLNVETWFKQKTNGLPQRELDINDCKELALLAMQEGAQRASRICEHIDSENGAYNLAGKCWSEIQLAAEKWTTNDV